MWLRTEPNPGTKPNLTLTLTQNFGTGQTADYNLSSVMLWSERDASEMLTQMVASHVAKLEIQNFVGFACFDGE